eukprot:UN12466
MSYLNKPMPPQTKQEEKRSNEYFTEWFTVCGVAYAQFEHPLFIRAVRSLRPSYLPPTASTATTTYIDILIKKEDIALRQELDGKMLQIMADGSNDGGKHPLVHIVSVCDIGARLLAIIHHEPGKKLVAGVMIEDLKQTKTAMCKSGVDISYGCYIHDNENTEKLIGKKFVQEFNREQVGCGPHGLNKIM